MDFITSMRAVLNTLECVEVKGRDNLDRLLGCIQTVEEVLNVLTAPPKAPEAAKKEEKVNGR